MRIQQEILQKFLKAGKDANVSGPMLEDSLVPAQGGGHETNETADFGEASDEDKVERDY